MNKYSEPGHCDMCGRLAMEQFQIHRQVGGEFRVMCVCNTCRIQHEKELAMTRENFYRQFGG